ncbi:hypothetical protein M0R72_00065 [Candidatus Pacearchaeota archaeon]|nr:hypothetical protein [Candidatus Pacearchaeota archaeon]
MKVCTKCKFDYPAPLDQFFYKRNGTADGYQHRCKTCTSEFHKEHYQANKEYYKDKADKNNAIYRKRNLQFMVDWLKEHGCIDCGNPDPRALEFDHRCNKEYDISRMVKHRFQKLKEEILKCDVRCANCHRIKTAKERGFYKGIVL